MTKTFRNMGEVFLDWEAHYKRFVMQETWGHLAPQERRKYKGFIIFTWTCYGHLTVINNEFEDLEDSPWYYEDLHDFIADWLQENAKQGEIFRFDGTYIKFKNQNCKFSGKIKRVSYEK